MVNFHLMVNKAFIAAIKTDDRKLPLTYFSIIAKAEVPVTNS